jgi:hypothetical protein
VHFSTIPAEQEMGVSGPLCIPTNLAMAEESPGARPLIAQETEYAPGLWWQGKYLPEMKAWLSTCRSLLY